MSFVKLQNVSVEIPVFDHSGQRFVESLRNRFSREPAERVLTSTSALRDVTLSVKSGERIGLLGSNGSGKTTLLRLLSGVYPPTSGTRSIEGQITSFLDMTFGIEPELTGREAIFLRSQLLGNSKSQVRERLEEIIDFSELGVAIDRPTRTYSSGMFLRLAFSISTVLKPEILLMDEWLSVGDKSFREKAEKKLSQTIQQTSILVIASHSRDLIERTCSRAIILRDGAVVADGDAQTVCETYFG